MKKIVIAGTAVVVIVAAAYPASAWFLGQRVEADFAAQYKALEDQGLLKVVSRDYQRSLFGATEKVTLELMPDFKKALISKMADKVSDIPDLKLTFQSTIKHGPFIAGGVGSAAIDSELVLDGKVKTEVEKLFGTAKPLEVHTRRGLFGGGSSHLSSPAFKTSFPGKGDAPVQIAWGGISVDMDYTSKLASYKVKAEIPGLDVGDDEGKLGIHGIHIKSDSKRVLGEGSKLFLGSAQVELDTLDLALKEQDKNFSVKKLVYSIDTPVKGDFVDLIAKIGTETVAVAGKNYGPAHFDMSFNHVKITALDNFQRKAEEMNQKALATGDPETSAKAALEALREPVSNLLKDEPELRIDRIQFATEQGQANASAALKLPGFQATDFDNPFSLIGKVDVQAELKLPEAMLIALVTNSETGDPDTTKEQIETMVQQGYAVRQGNVLSSKFSFKAGKMMLNGKPFGPGA